MREKPILFNSDMVRAILGGRKTQTRRVIKGLGNTQHYTQLLGAWGLSEDPQQWDGEDQDRIWQWRGKRSPQKGDWIWQLQCDVDDAFTWPLICPYGEVGDQLWVRETFSYNGGIPIYRAEGEWDGRKKWHPSIHMPRKISRINLKITDIRVERVQQISGSDVLAEGLNSHVHKDALYYNRAQQESFSRLWDSINAKRGFGWDVNSWVWVVEFEVIA